MLRCLTVQKGVTVHHGMGFYTHTTQLDPGFVTGGRPTLRRSDWLLGTACLGGCCGPPCWIDGRDAAMVR